MLVLTIVFIILKLCEVICWKWIWVLSPLWIDLAFTTLIFAVMYLVNAICDFVETQKYKRNTTYGRPLVWDVKTNTMHGPFEKGE